MVNLNVNTLATDGENNRLINVFKNITDKNEIANILANETVTKGLKVNSTILRHFYGIDEPSFITESCICFGLLHYMAEDFFTVKEILGYKYVLRLLLNENRFISIVR